jgi:FMN reductase
MYLIFSTSLSSTSRSRMMARAAARAFERAGLLHEFIDLVDWPLPDCDGASCYRHPAVGSLAEKIRGADAVALASPIYNYDVSASAKRLIELTGRAWENKIVGLMAAAGGSSSFMSVMGFANSLMLDFRTLIVPRFVFAAEDELGGDTWLDGKVQARIEGLASEMHRLASALRQAS